MQRKRVPTFLLHVAFLVALAAVLPGTREATPRPVHAVGNALLGSLSEGRSVRFESPSGETRRGRADTNMLGRKEGQLKYDWRVTFSSYRRLFWPLATLAALVLATPMPRRRLAVALPVSLLAMFAFFMLQLALFAAVLTGAKQPVAAGGSSLWRDALPITEAMFNSPITNFSLVFLLWAALSAPNRGLDTDSLEAMFRRLLGPGRRPPPAETGAPRSATPEEASERPED